MGHFFLVKTLLNVLKLCVCVRLCDIKSFCYFRDINKSGIKEWWEQDTNPLESVRMSTGSLYVWSRLTQEPWLAFFLWGESVRTTWVKVNLPAGCRVWGGARYLVLFHLGPDEKDQRTHNTLDEEYPKLALSVPGVKPYSREETMVPSGYQDGSRCSRTTCIEPSGSVHFSHSVMSDSLWPHGP